MNANGHFEEDDLALYALHLLAEPEASAVARQVEASEEARRDLVEVQARLAVYAESAVELEPAPEGSLDRLMQRIAREKKVVAMPMAVPAEPIEERRGRTGDVLPWIGWAVAAGMAVGAGKLYQDRVSLDRMLTAQAGRVEHMSTGATEASRQRDAVTASLAERTRELEALRTEVASARGEASTLRAARAGQAAKLNEQAARMNDQTAKLSAQAAIAADTGALAANAARERDALRRTVEEQAKQMARLSTDAARARQVLEALNDPTALRVTLTKPKTSAEPTGRATYVASRGTLVFQASNLAPLQANKVYQLWLLPANGSKPVPAGTFTPDARGNASVVSEKFPGEIAAKGFAVTIENEGGALTPTLPILLAGV